MTGLDGIALQNRTAISIFRAIWIILSACFIYLNSNIDDLDEYQMLVVPDEMLRIHGHGSSSVTLRASPPGSTLPLRSRISTSYSPGTARTLL